jgi:hypothetical protein
LAEALAYHTSNKPLFGFAKRHREYDPAIQKQLNIALLHHTEEGNEKGVQLCLWAGPIPIAPRRVFASRATSTMTMARRMRRTVFSAGPRLRRPVAREMWSSSSDCDLTPPAIRSTDSTERREPATS